MIAMVLKVGFDDLKTVGDYLISDDCKTMLVVLPGSESLVACPHAIDLDPANTPHWVLTGTHSKPSLTPSLSVTGWHGYIINGNIVNA